MLFSACGTSTEQSKGEDVVQTSNEQIDEKTNEQTNFPNEYKNEMNGVIFDVVLEIPENLDFSQLKKSTASAQRPDMNKVIEAFVTEQEISEEFKDKGIGPNGEQFDTHYLIFKDGGSLYVANSFSYATPLFGKIQTAFRRDTADNFTKNEELSFGSSNQAFETIKVQLNGVGYELQELRYDFYALDAHTLSQQEMQEDIFQKGEQKTEWNGNEDAYYFFAEQIYQGLPVFFGSKDFPQDDENYRPIEALYSQKGIEYLSAAPALYRFHSQNGTVVLADFEIIAQSVAQKYGSLLTNESYGVHRAKLCQIPVQNQSGGYDVKIGWLIEMTVSGVEEGQACTFPLYTFVDAENGLEIIL